MDRYCPTEDAEETAFSDWCERQGLTHWHVPQETYTTSWKQKAHNKSLGVLEGVSDHWVKLPTTYCPNGSLLVIEFKRQFGNTPTNAQIRFLDEMNTIDNVAATCCYGADEAIRMVEEIMKGVWETFDKCQERVKKLKEKRLKKPKNRPEEPKKVSKSKNDLPY